MFLLIVKTMSASSQSEKHAKTKSGDIKNLTADEFDELADSGQDMSDYLDWDKAVRGDSKRINIDLPTDFLAGLDREAQSGLTRPHQSDYL